MKKVLIIDDRQENLEAAKKFFSNIQGFEFLFVTNRKEAEKLLEISDAVITDGSFPYKDERNFDNAHGLNGYYILLLASAQNKPGILLSDHGEQFYSKLAQSQKTSKKVLKEELANFDPLNMDHYAKYWSIAYNPDIIVNLPTRSFTTKKNSSGWEYGWKELQRQF